MFIVAPLADTPFHVSALQASTGTADNVSQDEDSLEDDGDMHRTRTAAARRKPSQVRLWNRRRCAWQATGSSISAAEPVRLGSRGGCAWQPTIFGSSATELRKWFNDTALGLNSSVPCRHSAWQLKQRNSRHQLSLLLCCIQFGTFIRVRVTFPYYYFMYSVHTLSLPYACSIFGTLCFAALLQYIRLQDSRVYILHAQYFLSYKQWAACKCRANSNFMQLKHSKQLA